MKRLYVLASQGSHEVTSTMIQAKEVGSFVVFMYVDAASDEVAELNIPTKDITYFTIKGDLE